MRRPLIALAVVAFIGNVTPAAQAIDEGSSQQSTEKILSWEGFERGFPESAKNAFQSCAMDDLNAALADIRENNEAKADLTRVRDALNMIANARVKSEEARDKGNLQEAVEALEPALKRLPDLMIYSGCRKYAGPLLEAMATLRAPFQLRNNLRQAINACDVHRIHTLADKISSDDWTEVLIKNDASLKESLSVISALDAAEQALQAGDVDEAEAALATSNSALKKSSVGNCEEAKASVAETQSAIATLRDYDAKLRRASADCDRAALKGILDDLSETSGLWVGPVRDQLTTAYRACSAQTASWAHELEKDF